MKKEIGSFLTGAVATASLPPSIGVLDWRIIAGAAVIGGIGSLCGVNVAATIKRKSAERKAAQVSSE